MLHTKWENKNLQWKSHLSTTYTNGLASLPLFSFQLILQKLLTVHQRSILICPLDSQSQGPPSISYPLSLLAHSHQHTIYSSFLLSFKIILFWFCIILQLYPMSLLLFFKSNILKVVLTCSLHLTSNSVFPKNVSCMHVSKWYILIESNNLLRNFKTTLKKSCFYVIMYISEENFI